MNSAYGFVRALSLDLGTLSGLIARSGVRSVNDSKPVSEDFGDDHLPSRLDKLSAAQVCPNYCEQPIDSGFQCAGQRQGAVDPFAERTG